MNLLKHQTSPALAGSRNKSEEKLQKERPLHKVFQV